MMLWRFDEFVHGVESLRGIIKDDMAVGPRAELDVILTEHLGIREIAGWKKPYYLSLGDGLGEIRFTVDNVEYRIFGSFGGRGVFRMWLAATKHRKRKGKQATDPPDAIEKARKRKRDFEIHRKGMLRPYA